MKITIRIKKELGEWWGIEDLLSDNKNLSMEDKKMAIIELVNEDIGAFLHGALWEVSIK